jgi:Pretoxin HINT domain/DNA/RNA non-specific endonuclease/Pre-toxin TG
VAGEDPTQVTAPNQGTPPVTGSSSATSVSAPVGSVPVSNPTTVKPPAGTTTKPSGTVSPTSSGGGTVTLLNFRWTPTGDCIQSWVFGSTSDTNCAEWDLGATKRSAERAVEAATGDAEVAAAFEQLNLANASIQDSKSHNDARGELEKLYATPEYQSYSPYAKIALNHAIDRGLHLGTIGQEDLKQLNHDIKAFKFLGTDINKNGTYDFYFGGSLEGAGKKPWWLSATALGAGSFALGFVPVLGDGLAVAGAILGKDPITGETLSGPFRWLGLLGLIGLGNEVKDIVKAGQIAREASALSRVDNAVMFGEEIATGCLRGNSFSSDTKVWVSRTSQDLGSTLKPLLPRVRALPSVLVSKAQKIVQLGLTAIAISSVTIGTPVLAFNENSKLEQIQPVTATHVHLDPVLVKLTLETSNGKTETLTTTPKHPFYALTEANPKANGVWVDAGKLKRGNWLKRANNNYGVVKWVQLERQRQEMYNLTVAQDHTFFVGDGQWLVHNVKCPLSVVRGAGGRTESVTATLDSAYIGGGTSPSEAARAFVRTNGNAGDDAGHILARILGGGGGIRSGNIMPFNSTVNRGIYAQLERDLANAVRGGSSVSVEIALDYVGTGSRPSTITYNYWVDGIKDVVTFVNP